MPTPSVASDEPVQAELEALTILDKDRAAWQTSDIETRKQRQKQLRKNNKMSQKNCVLAGRLLDEIEQKRSRGYRLSEVSSLDQETRKLEGVRRTNCRP